MLTIKDVRESKKFLTYEQELGLIGLVTGKVSRAQKDIISGMLKYSFYSLEDATYWGLIHVYPDGVSLSSEAMKSTLVDAREHIVSQYRG